MLPSQSFAQVFPPNERGFHHSSQDSQPDKRNRLCGDSSDTLGSDLFGSSGEEGAEFPVAARYWTRLRAYCYLHSKRFKLSCMDQLFPHSGTKIVITDYLSTLYQESTNKGFITMETTEKLSEHFTLGELIRSETAERKGINNMPPENIIPKLKRLCEEILEPVRVHYGRSFRPNSGYRSPELNADIGGSQKSQHCLGEAVDIEIHGISNYELAMWIEKNVAFDQLILECYRSGEPNSGWVHISCKERGTDNRMVALTYSNRTYSEGLMA